MKIKNSSLLILFLVLSFHSYAYAQNGFAEMGKPGEHKSRLSVKTNYGLLYSHASDSSVSRSQSLRQIDGHLYFPFYQTESSSYAFTGRSRHLNFKNLNDVGDFKAINALSDYQFGFVWSHQQTEAKSWNTSVTYGSASDKPFENSSVSVLGATLTYKHDTSETNSWMYFLNYSNNRTFLNNLVLPGFAYSFMHPSKTRGGIIGLPFFSYWHRPTPKMFNSIFIFAPSVIRAQSAYMIWGPLQGNIKLDWSQLTYIREDSTHSKERLYFDSKRVSLGLKAFLSRSAFVELDFGRAFKRTLFNGESVFKPSSTKLRLNDEWQGGFTLQTTF